MLIQADFPIIFMIISAYLFNSSPIFTGDGEAGTGFNASATASGFEFGVDPNLDPELALALRVSMEEERARQEAAAKKAAEDASKQEKGQEQSTSKDATMTENANPVTTEPEKKAQDLMVCFSSFYYVELISFLQNVKAEFT